MDDKQKRLIRNIVAGVVLLTLLVLVMGYCGVFEGARSDEAQIRELIERSKTEINDKDWDDFFALCDLHGAERDAWRKAVPAQADRVQIDAITPKGFINVPVGATEYELEVSVVAHLDMIVTSRQLDSVEGTMFFVKKGDRWFIDLERSSSTFPYVPKPKR